jgi:hypothetical protein
MDPILLDIIKIIGTVIVSVGGVLGGQAAYRRIKNQPSKDDLTVSRVECSLLHAANVQAVADNKEDIGCIKNEILEIRECLQVLIRIEEKVINMESSLGDRIETRIMKIMNRHLNDFHNRTTTGRVPVYDTDEYPAQGKK